MRLIRVFPRRTKATPIDDLVVINRSPGMFDEADEIHISVTFTWDLPVAEKLEKEWKYIAPVKIGGPALNEQSDIFIPGLYLRRGYVITSRGCPNRCWFCSVWQRERNLKELPICDGWNILDDNLLACSDLHIKNVFAMLARQPQPPQFTGGLEAKRVQVWHAQALKELHAKQIFFAYDTQDDLEPLKRAGKIMLDAGFTLASHSLRCYVLCGWKKDTIQAAEKRMHETIEAGFIPMAMVWRSENGERTYAWSKFQREWARPSIICSKKQG